MVNLKTLKREVELTVKEAGPSSASFTALNLIMKVTGASKEDILRGDELDLSKEEYQSLMELAKKRAAGYPLQYLIGSWDFYGLEFFVSEGVLIPRPETEILCEEAISFLKAWPHEPLEILDLCCGTGCIGISIAKGLPNASAELWDISEEALALSQRNIAHHGLSGRVEALSRDVLSAVSEKAYDLIVSNPPYLDEADMKSLQKEVSFEPALALFGGSDGLMFYLEISKKFLSFLKPHGKLMFECGQGQAEKIKAILSSNGGVNIEIKKDYNGINRIISAQKIQ